MRLHGCLQGRRCARDHARGVGLARDLARRRDGVRLPGLARGRNDSPRRDSARGFTLIEVLVAMTILAVGVSALVMSAASSTGRADMLRNREMARWVASNTLAEWQAVPAWPEIGTTNTEATLADRRWFVRTRVQKVADDDLRRIDIEVRLARDEEGYLYAVKGFVGNPEFRS